MAYVPGVRGEFRAPYSFAACPYCGKASSSSRQWYVCQNCGEKFLARGPDVGTCPHCGESGSPSTGDRVGSEVGYDEAFDAAVKLEIESGQIREDLWATALLEAGSSEDAARAVYFRLRVEQLKAEYRRHWAEHE